MQGDVSEVGVAQLRLCNYLQTCHSMQRMHERMCLSSSTYIPSHLRPAVTTQKSPHALLQTPEEFGKLQRMKLTRAYLHFCGCKLPLYTVHNHCTRWLLLTARPNTVPAQQTRHAIMSNASLGPNSGSYTAPRRMHSLHKQRLPAPTEAHLHTDISALTYTHRSPLAPPSALSRSYWEDLP